MAHLNDRLDDVAERSTQRGETLASTYPLLAAQWHPTRNGNLTADDVSRSSMQRVWWLCRDGHEWQASVNNRERGRGCPVCGNRQVLAGFNDLATVDPDVAAQWHPTRNGDLTAGQVTAGSSRRVWWLCPVAADHEWQATVANRTSPATRSGCPVCAGRVVVPSTSLAVLHPDLAAQWHPTRNGTSTAEQVTPRVTRRVWWLCRDGHEWQAAIASRTVQGTGCPYCSGRAAVPGVTSLAVLHPDVAGQWHPTLNGTLTADEVRPGSNRQVWWLCRDGHEWQATVTARVARQSGCPLCAGQRPIVGVNDLSVTHPHIATQLHPTRNGELSATDLMAGTSRKVWWLCDAGHPWKAPVYNRTAGVGCPICANKQVLAGFNDLATVDPDLATQWHPSRNGDLTAAQVTRSSSRKVWWWCRSGHEWQSTVSNRTTGNGCPVCANRQVLAGFNDLATVDPDLAAQWHPSRNGDLTAAQVVGMSNRKVWWLCPAGHEWRTAVVDRRSGSGCPSCATYGFNPSLDAWLYLLFHDGWQAHQIGITNQPTVRLTTHRRSGWEVVDVRGPMNGDLAASLERAALRALKRRGARLGTRSDSHRFDGFTESWPVTSLADVIAFIHADDMPG